MFPSSGCPFPNICKPYIHDCVVPSIVLWSTTDLGYLTVYAGAMLAEHKLESGSTSGPTSIEAGRLGTLQVRGSDIILGAPLIINKANVDQIDF